MPKFYEGDFVRVVEATCLALIPEEEKDLYLAIWELQER